MRTRKPHGWSEQPSNKPSFRPLLQLGEVSEKHEDEVDAELLTDGSRASSDQYDARRNSTSEELPEVESGKEVAVRSVNPSLQVHDGEEHANSKANSLKVNREAKNGNHVKGTLLMRLAKTVLSREFPGASNLNPLLIEESESDSELPTQIHSSPAPEELQGARNLHPLRAEESEADCEPPTQTHPSSAPEGSLLHALYLQLLGAGTDGITLGELFQWFEEPAEVLSFGSDWKDQVWWHLKTNPHFCEAEGYHYLTCNHQLQGQQPKPSRANAASTSRRDGASSSKSVPSSQLSTPAAEQSDLWVDTHEGVVPTRRKAFYQANASMSQQAIDDRRQEFEEMHQSRDQSTGDMQMPSSVADPRASQLVQHGPLPKSSRKRKSPPSHNEELAHHGRPIPGGLQASQAEILAMPEVQTGQRCTAQKVDDTGNWRCRMMAMAGHTLCNHHRSLQPQVDGQTSLSPNAGSPKYSSALRPPVAPEAGVQARVRCDHRIKPKDGTQSSQCRRMAMQGHRLCEHHKQQLEEERKARPQADAPEGKQDSSIVGLPESDTILHQSSLSLHPKSAAMSPPISGEDIPRHSEAAKDVDKPATGVPTHDDDSNGEPSQQQMPKSVPKRHHVSARKTAANVGPLKSQSLIRTPTIPPLPPPYGIRRKTPAKEREQLRTDFGERGSSEEDRLQ